MPPEGAPAAYPATPPRRGDEVELRVDALAHGGAGVGRVDGYVVFVAGAVPGDRVRVRIGKRKRSWAEGELVELVEASPDRIAPRAPHPGAPWQVLRYERQLAEKQSQVEDALRRLGGFESPPVEPIVPATSQWRYRNKVEYSFGEGPDGAPVLGFHRPGRWNEIDPLDADVLASESVDELRLAVADWARAAALPAWDRASQSGLLRNLVVRQARATGQLQARLITTPGKLDSESLVRAVDADGLLWTRTPALSETTAEGETRLLSGSDELIEELTVEGRRLRFAISPEAFFQTNTEMAQRLYELVWQTAALSGRERVFDLYCGIGTIALSLAAGAGEVWGIEVVERAVADAIANARLNGVDNVGFYAGNVRTALPELVERAGRPDLLVVDPPRAGLSQKVVRRLIDAGPDRIVYVSCNPTTLAPNARQLADAGYRLERVTPVDMFPQTPHVECVALLERSS